MFRKMLLILSLYLTLESCKTLHKHGENDRKETSTSPTIEPSVSNEGQNSILPRNPIAKYSVQFALNEPTKLKLADFRNDAKSLLLKISRADGTTSDFKLKILDFDGSQISEPISLEVEGTVSTSFKLEEFQVLDKDDKTIFVTPKQGTTTASLVKTPLPISFQTSKDNVTKVTPEVIEANQYKPKDFGYVAFGAKVVEYTSFLITPFIFNSIKDNYALTTAKLKIYGMDGSKDEYVLIFEKDLSNITNIVLVPKEIPMDHVKMEVTKNDYLMWTNFFFKSDLDASNNNPIKVVLVEGEAECRKTGQIFFNNSCNQPSVTVLNSSGVEVHVPVTAKGNSVFFEGDIEIANAQDLVNAQNTTINLTGYGRKNYWDFGIVAIDLNSSDFQPNELNNIKIAMKNISDLTGIFFVDSEERNKMGWTTPPRVIRVKGSLAGETNQCFFSFERNLLYFETGSFCPNAVGSLMHEMLHSLGIAHEQFSPDAIRKKNLIIHADRSTSPDQYVDSIPKKYDEATGYDICSIMHYGALDGGSSCFPIGKDKAGNDIFSPNFESAKIDPDCKTRNFVNTRTKKGEDCKLLCATFELDTNFFNSVLNDPSNKILNPADPTTTLNLCPITSNATNGTFTIFRANRDILSRLDGKGLAYVYPINAKLLDIIAHNKPTYTLTARDVFLFFSTHLANKPPVSQSENDPKMDQKQEGDFVDYLKYGYQTVDIADILTQPNQRDISIGSQRSGSCSSGSGGKTANVPYTCLDAPAGYGFAPLITRIDRTSIPSNKGGHDCLYSEFKDEIPGNNGMFYKACSQAYAHANCDDGVIETYCRVAGKMFKLPPN